MSKLFKELKVSGKLVKDNKHLYTKVEVKPSRRVLEKMFSEFKVKHFQHTALNEDAFSPTVPDVESRPWYLQDAEFDFLRVVSPTEVRTDTVPLSTEETFNQLDILGCGENAPTEQPTAEQKVVPSHLSFVHQNEDALVLSPMTMINEIDDLNLIDVAKVSSDSGPRHNVVHLNVETVSGLTPSEPLRVVPLRCHAKNLPVREGFDLRSIFATGAHAVLRRLGVEKISSLRSVRELFGCNLFLKMEISIRRVMC